jgi:predicted HicB family RNase H-like nuclease
MVVETQNNVEKVNMKIDIRLHTRLRVLAARQRRSLFDLTDEIIRKGIAAQAREIAAAKESAAA